MEPQTLATIALAVLGACIAWGQWVTARSKLILDLYEHRRKVYSDFHGPVGQAMREGRSDLQNYVDYIRVLDQAQFLFGRDVLDYIEDMRDTLNKLGEVTSMLRGGNDQRMPEEERLKHVRLSHELMREIADFWKHLDKLMIPYMLMEQKRPWSIGGVTGYVGHKARKASKAHRKWRGRQGKAKATKVGAL